MRIPRLTVALALLASAVSSARADRQRIAPGTGQQDAVVVDTGANGLCETTAARDDIQAANLGQGTAFEPVIRCGLDRVASTTAAGDDRQLVAVGDDCQNRNTVLVDSGSNGIAETAGIGDDEQDITVGGATPNGACVVTGANGIADTGDPVGGDDVRLVVAGTAPPNTPVIRCGANRIADTRANNVTAGDDVQLVAVGGACPAANTNVVDSGANGIAETRAEGPDLVLELARPLKVVIKRKQGLVRKTVKVLVRNVEFGPVAPAARAYQLFVTDGSCPNGTVTQVDADTRAGGLQPTAAVARGGRAKGSFVVELGLQDVVSVDRKIPFRCAVEVTAQAVDTLPADDDAINDQNNQAEVVIEAVDQADL